MAIRTTHFDFSIYNTNIDFHLPGRATQAGSYCLGIDVDKLKAFDNAKPLPANVEIDLRKVTDFVRSHIGELSALKKNDPSIRPNTLLDPIRSLIQEHNSRVENSIGIRILTVILQILTLGIYNYKNTLLIDPIGRALGGGATLQRKVCAISEQKRYQIRDKTNVQLHQHLANQRSPFLSEKDKVCLYTNDQLQYLMSSTALLPPFDVLQVPCYMDYDEKWEPHSGKQEYFFAHHVAAPDLSSDYGFDEYSDRRCADQGQRIRGQWRSIRPADPE